MANVIRDGSLGTLVLLLPVCAGAAETSALAASSAGVSPGYFIKLLAALVFVVAIFFAFAWVMKKINRLPGGVQSLKVVSGLSLGSREKLLVVQVGDEQLLIGVAPGSVTCLHQLQKPLPEQADNTNGSFARVLERAAKNKSGESS
ncbi:flagellar biosynthetic protein FliO [Granulosicoccaceae sp. 1_MG-2023]|nr:flagellar biosynthetic protein FliO [Granulosicoccaceae sp. 1_MG-2023]